MPLTTIQRRKLSRLYSVYDLDNNGVIEKSDYQRLVNALAGLQGWQPGDPGFDRLHENFVGNIWQHLSEFGDDDADGKITLEEWLAYNEEMLSSEESYLNEVASRAALVFEALDTNGDGRYTVDDFERFYRAYGIDEGLAAGTFQRLDRNGDGELSQDEIEPLCREFYYSTDPGAPGNFFFGTF